VGGSQQLSVRLHEEIAKYEVMFHVPGTTTSSSSAFNVNFVKYIAMQNAKVYYPQPVRKITQDAKTVTVEAYSKSGHSKRITSTPSV